MTPFKPDDLPALGRSFLHRLSETNRTDLLSMLNIKCEDYGLCLNFDNMDSVDSICLAVSSLYSQINYFQFKTFENKFLDGMNVTLLAAVWNILYDDAPTYHKYADVTLDMSFDKSITYFIQQKVGW